MHWTSDDINSGTLVTKRRSAANPHFKIPAIIVHTPHPEREKGWGLCDLSDGLLMGFGDKGSFGTKEELAAQLTEMGYFDVPKMIFSRGIETLPENRLSTPVLIMTHSKY
jgi:hypothetical protein